MCWRALKLPDLSRASALLLLQLCVFSAAVMDQTSWAMHLEIGRSELLERRIRPSCQQRDTRRILSPRLLRLHALAAVSQRKSVGCRPDRWPSGRQLIQMSTGSPGEAAR